MRLRWFRRHGHVPGTTELTEQIRLVRAQLTDLTVTLTDFDRRLTAVAERIHPDRTTMQSKGTPGE